MREPRLIPPFSAVLPCHRRDPLNKAVTGRLRCFLWLSDIVVATASSNGVRPSFTAIHTNATACSNPRHRSTITVARCCSSAGPQCHTCRAVTHHCLCHHRRCICLADLTAPPSNPIPRRRYCSATSGLFSILQVSWWSNRCSPLSTKRRPELRCHGAEP